MSKETQTDMDLTDKLIQAFGENQQQITVLVHEINAISEKTILPEKKEQIASFRGQMLAMDVENQMARINFMKEFIKEIS